MLAFGVYNPAKIHFSSFNLSVVDVFLFLVLFLSLLWQQLREGGLQVPFPTESPLADGHLAPELHSWAQ